MPSPGRAPLTSTPALVRARHRLRVDVQLGAEPDLPLSVKEALYRIAREALHNVVKHARAGSASLSIHSSAGALLLEGANDGVGFDPAAEYPGHLGLASMAGRARAAGGDLSLESEPGHGSRVA